MIRLVDKSFVNGKLRCVEHAKLNLGGLGHRWPFNGYQVNVLTEVYGLIGGGREMEDLECCTATL